MSGAVALPARLDSAAARRLASELAAQEGAALALDASGLEMLGAAGAEVLISAARTWKATGQALRLDGLSDKIRDDLDRLGLGGHAPFTKEPT